MKNLKVLKSDTIKAQWLDIKEQYDTDDFDLEKGTEIGLKALLKTMDTVKPNKN